MKKLLTALAILLLSACDGSTIKPSKKGELSIYVYVVEGIPLECVNLHYRLSCNWEKYNAQNLRAKSGGFGAVPTIN
ncbi:hypothetical protein [Endozoicomonas sp. G2_1]|uniref:hypothetical protein n=1 Tax=Endozoicomonas sp. G2_1 TaxID=2821091 RepID=UPI001ADD4C71|nr:hypothetical protein [Endozoicomonas sp. G2_1]